MNDLITNFVVSSSTYDSVTLTWTAPRQSVVNYYISISSDGGLEYNTPVTLAGNVNTYTFTGLTSNTPYMFSIYATVQGYDGLAPTPTVTTTTPLSPSQSAALHDATELQAVFNPYTNTYSLQPVDAGVPVGSGSGSNPTGGTVDIATANYQITLLQQWISLTIGSSSAQLLNLLNSELETFNLATSTFLYAGYASPFTNGSAWAASDNFWALQAASGARLAGVMNPCHLKMLAHFEGSNGAAFAATDNPVYISSNGAAPIRTTSAKTTYVSTFAVNGFVGGTPSSSAGTAANAFDGNITDSVAAGTNQPYVQYDLGSGNAQILKYFMIYMTDNTNTTWTVQGSNDASSWTTLATATGVISQQDVLMNASSNTTAYRYYRYTTTNTSVSSLAIYGFSGFTKNPVPTYDTSTALYGTSSANFYGSGLTGGTFSNTAMLQDQDWQFRGGINFTYSTPTDMTIFTLTGQMEIHATSTTLRLRYTLDGTNWTNVDSSAITWNTNAWHYISVRRTSNTLYFFVDGVAKGTADLTGVKFNPASSTLYLGLDSNTQTNFVGNMDELEFFMLDHDTDSAPASARSTDYIPALSVTSAATYIPTASSINVLAMIDETTWASMGAGVPAVNTDWQVSVSTDNGSTWNQVTMMKSSKLSTLTVMYTGNISLTDINNTNQLMYRITSSSGKVLKLDGIIVYWS